jgi:hypothetical protein
MIPFLGGLGNGKERDLFNHGWDRIGADAVVRELGFTEDADEL